MTYNTKRSIRHKAITLTPPICTTSPHSRWPGWPGAERHRCSMADWQQHPVVPSLDRLVEERFHWPTAPADPNLVAVPAA